MRHKHHCAPSHRGRGAREWANRAAPCGQGWIDFPIRIRYFTCLANGCSRMYKASDIAAMVEGAGMQVERVTGTLGICSSLMICRRR